MWKVRFNPKVLEEDLPALDAGVQRMIMKAILKKLTVAPQNYGGPLRGELFGYRKLRVSEYRVLYRILNDVLEVLIIQIGPRRASEAYSSAVQRLKNHP